MPIFDTISQVVNYVTTVTALEVAEALARLYP
jgi:hypothetical protein